MHNKNNFYLTTALIFLAACTTFNQKKNSFNKADTIKCAVKDEESKLWNKRTNLGPNGQDADESLFVYNELMKRLDDPQLKIGRKPYRLANGIIIFGPVEDSNIEKICCILRTIMEEKRTKPISVIIEELQDYKNERNGQLEKRSIPVKGYVVE